jgi:pimeloyl-ACP methyl ester carboxylesterase
VQRQYVHLGDRTIAYLDSAPADRTAPAILLIHAFPLSAVMWEAQAKALPSGWRLIAPDLRGFGGSTIDHEPESPSVDDYAVDIIDLMKELGISPAVVGGCSMGGYVTFAILRRAPELVRAIVLADTRAGADSLEGRANRRSMLALLDREGTPGVARDMIPKLLGKTTLDERSDVESNIRRLIRQQSPQAIRGAILRMMQRPDSFSTLKDSSAPALVIVGTEDTLTPVNESRAMVDALHTAELVEVPRAGHLANIEDPDAFNAALARFLSRL